jgi:amino acid adenylation domain-containing protein
MMVYVLPQLLSRSAHTFPDKTAVECAGRSLTYARLENESNRLARLLRKEGVRPGDRVGLYLSKSVETVLGIFAVLKAGAAYVPIDPQIPLQRLAFIIQNCGIRHLLTTASKAAACGIDRSKRLELDCVWLLDEERAVAGDASSGVRWRHRRDADQEPQTIPANPAIATDLAYILYTSGSTGAPKGVMISHLNALTFINWASDCLAVQSNDCLSNHAPFHFDLSIFDLFVAVKNGATVHLVPEQIVFFPADLARFIATNKITVWYSVPSVLILLVSHARLSSDAVAALRAILFAGEVFPTKYLRSLMSALPQTRFFNLYGPTETNVCTYYEVESPPEDDAPIPIGKACENTDVFALNERGERAGVGSEGVLYVRGTCVTKGYWGLPQKTAESLLHWQDASGHTEALYRTGDIVVLGEDGNYQFLGRRDHMVKSRGYRIELGEVEAALYSHTSVQEAVVLPIPDEKIGNRLRGLVVTSNKEVAAAELARHCAERLPKYMVPEVIELRDNLPKTSTGKIDRQRLLQDVMSAKPVPL